MKSNGSKPRRSRKAAPAVAVRDRGQATRRKIIAESRRWLAIINAHKLNEYKRRKIVADTVDNFRLYYNKGYLEYRKSVTEGGEFAAIEWSGKGTYFEDITGRRFIDCLGGYGIYSAGINHPKIVRAVKSQLDRMPLSSQELLDPLRGALAELLGELAPGDLQDCFFISNGTDAVDAVESELEKAEAVGMSIAAVVAEPVQGEAGAIVPPDDFWPRLRKVCTRHGVLLIADEVQTGMGRTGKMFGVEHWDVVPDIMCLGKALGGGVMPLSAFMSTPEIWKVLEPNPFIHSSTFGGNPLACAAGIAAVNVTLEEDLPGQAAATGEYFLSVVDAEFGYAVAAGLFKRGVLVAGTLLNAKTVRIEPALAIPRELVDEVLEKLEETLEELKE